LQCVLYGHQMVRKGQEQILMKCFFHSIPSSTPPGGLKTDRSPVQWGGPHPVQHKLWEVGAGPSGQAGCSHSFLTFFITRLLASTFPCSTPLLPCL
jgi:hypothetical protein